MRSSDVSSDVCSSDLFTAKWLNARLARYSASDGELRFSMMAADEPLDFTEANLDLAVRLLDGPGEHEGVRLGEAVFVTVEAAGGGPEHKIDWPGCPADDGMAIMRVADAGLAKTEEHTSGLQSLMRNSYAVFCMTKK